MAWPKGQPRNKAHEVAHSGASEVSATLIDDWIASMEERAMERGAVLVQASHPDAEDGKIHPGKYSGIRLVKGEPKAQMNTGEWLE